MNKKIGGIAGAIVGGFLFTIPWILVYIFGNMLFSILASFIAYGALLGYKKIVGETDKNTPLIITIVSILVIIITTLIIIPLCLLYREGFSVDFDNLKIIYGITRFKEAIIHDLIISVFFTFLGISGVVSKLKSEVDPNYNKKLEIVKNNVEKIKSIFLKHNATDKFNTISIDKILLDDNDKKLFKQLRCQQIIRKYKGNYFYSEKAEKSPLYRFSILYLKFLGILVLIVCLIILLVFIKN